ncbi:MAG: hypothetical protein WA632_12850 [Gallionella sp.]
MQNPENRLPIDTEHGTKLSYFSVRSRRYAPVVIVLVSVAIAVASYLQALHFPFISDDLTYIPDNERLLNLEAGDLWRLLVEPFNCCKEFLPLRDFSYWAEFTLFGENPAAFRVGNIVLYLLCLPLIYATTHGLWRYFRPASVDQAAWAAVAVTALFAIHPALVESVVWISGRKYILPNLFAMLALFLAVQAKRVEGLSAGYAFAALLAFVALMLSKSSYVPVAAVIALLWMLFWLDVPLQKRSRFTLVWPLAVLTLAGLLTANFIRINEGFDGMPVYWVSEVAMRPLAILGWMARLAISTENRHWLYPVFEDPYYLVMVAVGTAVFVVCLLGTISLFRRRSIEGFALVTFLLLCAPYIQLLPNHPPSVVADRYIALAVWPVLLLLVSVSLRLKSLPRYTLLLALALPWCYQTIERPRDWQDWNILMDADLRAFPGYYGAAIYKINNADLGSTESYDQVYKIAQQISDPEVRIIVTKLIKSDYEVHISAPSSGSPANAISMLYDAEVDLLQPPELAKWNSPRFKLWKALQIMLLSQWKALTEAYPGDGSIRYSAELWKMNVSELEPDFRACCKYVDAYKNNNRLEDAARAEAKCRDLPGDPARRPAE